MSSSWWCHPTISSSVILFSSCLQSFPVIGYFLMSKLFTSVGQSTGVSASASVLPMNIQDWFPLGCACWISLLSKGLWRVLSNTTVQNLQFFITHHSLCLNCHIHTWNWKNSFDYTELFQQNNVFAFKNVARLVITFLQTSKHLLISWLLSSPAVILEPLKIKSFTVSIVSPSICHERMGLDAMIFIF